MKNFKAYLFLFLTMSFFTTSCEKIEDLSASNTELLTTDEGWTFSSISTNIEELGFVGLILLTLPEEERTTENEAAITELLNTKLLIEDCEEDDVMIFNSNKTVTYLHGSVRCDEDEPDEETTESWSFNLDESQLTFEDLTFRVLKLNSNKLELEYSTTSKENLILATSFLLSDSPELSQLNYGKIEEVEGYQEFLDAYFIFTTTFKAN
ncbi:MAG: hypothetical protein ACPG49_10550 [Chitinophagales bacterium]